MPRISRRDFIKIAGTTSLSLFLSACGLEQITPSVYPSATFSPSKTPPPKPTETLPDTPTPTSTNTQTPSSTPTTTSTTFPPTLRELANASGIVLGTAIPEWYVEQKQQRKLLELASDTFNGINLQGIYLLWDKPVENRIEDDFISQTKIIQFAQEHKIEFLMGQHLVWNRVGIDTKSDSWLLKIFDKKTLLQLLTEHIEQVVAKYQQITYWSVVNEPFEIDNYWNRVFKSDYTWIENAFSIANQANPKAKLYLNDYGIEIPGVSDYNRAKSDKLLKLVTSMKQKNIPIHGIGFQMHVNGKDFMNEKDTVRLMESFRDNVHAFQNVGVEVYITELDIRLNELEHMPVKERFDIQALAYEAIMNAALESGIETIFLFGVWDSHSWFELYYGFKDADPLLFDEQLKPKPSYFAIRDVLTHHSR